MKSLLSASTQGRGTSPTKAFLASHGLAATVGLLMVIGVFYVFKLLTPQHSDPTIQSENRQAPAVASIAEATPALQQLDKYQADTVSVKTPSTLANNLGAQTLLDTDIDGALKVDSEGKLIIDLQTRDLFDYFLSAADEIGAQTAIEALRSLIHESLEPPALGQALDLLDRYLFYLRDQMQLSQQSLDSPVLTDQDALEVLNTINQQLAALRTQHFNQKETAALFGLEQANAEFTTQSLRVLSDQSLSLDDQRAQLSKLEAALPAELRRSMQATRAHKQQQAAIENIVSNTEAHLLYDKLREVGLSDGKANELTAYHQQQAHFEQQYQLYRLALDNRPNQYKEDSVDDADLLEQYFLTPEMQTAARLRDLQLRP